MNSQATDSVEFVWVFNGVHSPFPSGVFSTREGAEIWIEKELLSGTLTRYPLNIGAYEWSIAIDAFKPKREDHKTPEFIGKFSGGEEHYHFEDGHPA